MSAASSNNNMLASITASLEKSLTLNHHQTTPNSAAGLGYSSSDSPGNPSNYSDATTTLDLNSQISLPYHWEQCLDLKSGEIYYINWRTGMKAREDPRTTSPEDQLTTDLYYTEEEEEEEEDDDGRSRSSSSSSYDTDGEQGSSSKLKSSASPAGASSSMKEQLYHQNTTEEDDDDDDQVLVVAGCKVCLMYFMVPKQVQHCPKCTTAQLLHFL